MANYMITYDLYGSFPTHPQVKAHVANAGFSEYARILEDGWFIGTPHSLAEVHEYMMGVFSDNDRVFVCEIKTSMIENLQLSSEEYKEVFERNK